MQQELLEWYIANHREMPWRESKDPYKIWLSEIILQQTQVKQGTPYYNKFIEAYPSLSHLALTTEDELLKLWQGLGYYSRARNMHFTAKYIHNECNGKFPSKYKELLTLKGVGDYTAAAIASIAFDQPVAVLDGNVVRVLSRLFEIQESVQTGAGLKKFKTYAKTILNTTHPGNHNQAVMELGSLICKPTQPLCTVCPISSYCGAYLNKTTDLFPLKKNKIKVRNRYFNFIVPILDGSRTVLSKRTGNDIWKNLYTFPLIESDIELDQTNLIDLFSNTIYTAELEIGELKRMKHVLSHQIIYSTFFLVNVNHSSDLKRIIDIFVKQTASTVNENPSILNQQKFARLEKSNIFEVELKKVKEFYALPRLISRYLESLEPILT